MYSSLRLCLTIYHAIPNYNNCVNIRVTIQINPRFHFRTTAVRGRIFHSRVTADTWGKMHIHANRSTQKMCLF